VALPSRQLNIRRRVVTRGYPLSGAGFGSGHAERMMPADAALLINSIQNDSAPPQGPASGFRGSLTMR